MEKQGSVLGGVLLIAGSCIGAGMLALPVITGVAGFIPAFFTLLFSWLFMLITSLLLLEANLTVGYHLSLISIAEKTLGKWGKFLCWILFLFLFYSLSIAYIAASGSILQTIISDLFNLNIPSWFGSLFFTVVFGFIVFIGVSQVDYFNRLLMLGLIISYCTLVILGSQHIHFDYLRVQHWQYAVAALPVLVISFGFHNMVPSLAMYMKGDIGRLKRVILFGSLIPFCIYLIWEIVMLGIIPMEGKEGLLCAFDKGDVATSALRAIVGKSWINTVAQTFALFAIITSFLAQTLSLVDFLSDGLKIPKIKLGRLFLIFLTLAPPFIFAFIYPNIFINALNFAGGFSTVILFGVIPALMVWVLRYQRKEKMKPLFPLGKTALIFIILIAFGIFFSEIAREFGLCPTPHSLEVAK